MIRAQSFLFPLFSGLLLAVAFEFRIFSWLVFISLLPFLIFLQAPMPPRRIFLGSWLFGVVFLGAIWRWMFGMYPLEWAGVSDPFVSILLLAGIWGSIVALLALLVGVFGVAISRAPISLWPALAPSLWVLGEYARSFVLTGVLWGSRAEWGVHWTFGYLGYVAAHIPNLLLLTKVTGLSGMSFLIVFFNAFLFVLFLRSIQKKYIAPYIVFLCALVIAVAFLAIRAVLSQSEAEPLREAKTIAILHTNFPLESDMPLELYKDFAREELALLQDMRSVPDVIVFPESSPLSRALGEAKLPSLLHSIFGEEKTWRAVYNAEREKGKRVVSALVYDSIARESSVASEKTLLIPGGEYLPLLVAVLTDLLGLDDFLQTFDRIARKEQGSSMFRQGSREGVLVCSAVMSPLLWRMLARNSAEIFINPTNLQRFHSSSFRSQALMALRVIAASNDRWMIQAAHNGDSYIIDNNGVVRSFAPKGSPSLVLTGNTEYRQTKPVSVGWYGDWPVALSLAFVFVALSREFYWKTRA